MDWHADIAEIFAITAEGVWVSDPEGRILFWNHAAETILEYPVQQVTGKLCRDVFSGCDDNGNRMCGWPCPVKTLLHGGELVEHFDMATRTRTGKPVWIDVSCLTLPSSAGQPPTVVHLFRDVTVAHQIEVLVRQQLAQSKLTTSEGTLTLSGELTPRELQVVTLMRAGATTASIAEQLFISKATVRNHIQNIFSKLKVHTRLEAVACLNQLAGQGSTTCPQAGSVPRFTKEVAKTPASRERKAHGSGSGPSATPPGVGVHLKPRKSEPHSVRRLLSLPRKTRRIQ